MKKKKIEDLPSIEEKDFEGSDEDVEKETSEEEVEEPKQEAGKMQIVTNEQLTQFKLDNLSSQVEEIGSVLQELTSQFKALVEILKKKK